MKECDICGKKKSLDDFYRKLSNPDGFEDCCKDCHTPRCETIGKRRYSTIYGRLIPLMKEMQEDEAAEAWFGRIMEILPENVQNKVTA